MANVGSRMQNGRTYGLIVAQPINSGTIRISSYYLLHYLLPKIPCTEEKLTRPHMYECQQKSLDRHGLMWCEMFRGDMRQRMRQCR